MSRELKEIGRILCGYSTHRSGYVVAVEGFRDSFLKGGFNGSSNIRMWGVYTLEREYLVGGKVQPHQQWAEQRVADMGYPAYLYNNPDSVCSLRMRMMGNPAFIMLEFDGKIIRVSVFTAKSLFAKRVCQSVLKIFEQGLPNEMRPLEQEETKNRKKAAQKQEKKNQQDEKKQAKKDKKAEKKAEAEQKAKEKQEQKAQKEERRREEKEARDAEREAEKELRSRPIESFEERSKRLTHSDRIIDEKTEPYEDESEFEDEDEFDI